MSVRVSKVSAMTILFTVLLRIPAIAVETWQSKLIKIDTTTGKLRYNY